MGILPLPVAQVPEFSVRGDGGVHCRIFFFPNTEGQKLDQRLLCISSALTHSAEALSHPRKKISRTAVDQRGSFFWESRTCWVPVFAPRTLSPSFELTAQYQVKNQSWEPGSDTTFLSFRQVLLFNTYSKDSVFLHDTTWKKKCTGLTLLLCFLLPSGACIQSSFYCGDQQTFLGHVVLNPHKLGELLLLVFQFFTK